MAGISPAGILLLI